MESELLLSLVREASAQPSRTSCLTQRRQDARFISRGNETNDDANEAMDGSAQLQVLAE